MSASPLSQGIVGGVAGGFSLPVVSSGMGVSVSGVSEGGSSPMISSGAGGIVFFRFLRRKMASAVVVVEIIFPDSPPAVGSRRFILFSTWPLLSRFPEATGLLPLFEIGGGLEVYDCISGGLLWDEFGG
jgi:hypothetical protein